MTCFHRCTIVLSVIVSCLGSAIPIAVTGQWSHDPNINNAISTAANDQLNPTMVSDGAGGVIVTWNDDRTGVGNADIYAQRVNSAGVAQWTTNGVAVCTATHDQLLPTIVSDGTGGAIITWEDLRSGTNYDIYAQRINSSGVVQWTVDGVSVSTAASDQEFPTIVSDGAGGAVITWQDYRSGNSDIYAQRVNSSGAVQWTSDGLAICTATNAQSSPTMVSDGSGGAIITWQDYRIGSSYDIYAQRVNGSGAVQWTSNGAAICTATNTQYYPTIVSDGHGGAIIAWQDGRSGAYYDIYAQRINGYGSAFWTSNGIAVSTASYDQVAPAIVTDGAGGAIIAWYDARNGSNYDIYAQRISSAGAVQWTADGVAISTAANNQQNASITTDGLGGAIVSWNDLRGGTYDVYAQRITGAGVVQWTTDGVAISTATGHQQYPTVASDGSGGAIIAWTDSRGSSYDIYAQNVDPNGYLGDARPAIQAVLDVKNDQGGKVSVGWSPSYLDALPNTTITSYYVFRGVSMTSTPEVAVPPEEFLKAFKKGTTPQTPLVKLPGASRAGESLYWQYLDSVRALRLPGYSYPMPTLSDSGPQGNSMTYAMIMARTDDDLTYWISFSDSGYSVDNLPPGPVMTVSALPQPGPSVNVHWSKDKVDPDVGLYEVHRSTVDGFTPGPSTKIGQTSDTALVDASPVNGSPNYYRVVTVDIHGNKSVPSQEASAGVTVMNQYGVADKWNLVSVPLTVGSYAKSVLYPTAVSNAFSYAGGYTQQATLSNGAGYWLKFAGGQNVSMTGFLLSSASIPVQSGWNLIGSISTAVPVGNITSNPGGMVASNFFGYESGYKVATQIEPGQGYWIKVNQSGNLILSGSNNTPSENRIRITPDGELPPAPPGDLNSNNSIIPSEFSLGQNYPNPFNPTTNFEYRIANIGFVSLKIFDVLGREVATLVNEQKPAGVYNVTWDASNVPSGMYFYKLTAGSFSETRKLMLLK